MSSTTRARRSKVVIAIDQKIEDQERIIAAANQKRLQLIEIRDSFEEAEVAPVAPPKRVRASRAKTAAAPPADQS